jgi:hypothetical protein
MFPTSLTAKINVFDGKLDVVNSAEIFFLTVFVTDASITTHIIEVPCHMTSGTKW